MIELLGILGRLGLDLAANALSSAADAARNAGHALIFRDRHHREDLERQLATMQLRLEASERQDRAVRNELEVTRARLERELKRKAVS